VSEAAPLVETDRLALRRLTHADAPFLVRLLNDPSFLRYIGDRGVRSEADAICYLDGGPLASYREHGFGLYLVTLRAGDTPIGICGLLKRETLSDVDLGFAFLPEFWSRGFATEAARAVLEHGRALGLDRIVAVTTQDNSGSIHVLQKLGLRASGAVRLSKDGPELLLFAPD
jgi:RimJ/RimL family protein N-acetyltransferase